MKLIRGRSLREGRWRNGLGVSWDIASDPPDVSDFGWRLAIARIDCDVPFSHYDGVDRIFTLLDGQGLDLDFEGGYTLTVDQRFVPHAYPCDVATFCRLRDGPCRALNLFVRRGVWKAAVEIMSGTEAVSNDGPILVHALGGPLKANGLQLVEGDTLVDEGRIKLSNVATQAYAARLTRLDIGGGGHSR